MEIIMKNNMNLLRKNALFEDFSSEELEKLFSEVFKAKNYKKNTVIYFQNEKCSSLDIIIKGTVTVQEIDCKGNVLTISDFTAGDILGANLLFSNNNFYPMTVLAKTDTVIITIEKDIVLNLCHQNKSFLYAFLQLISDKTLILTNKIKAISLKSIRQRIIDFLLYENIHQNSLTIELNISKKDLSEKFGIQRPSLSRELNKMRKDGLITYDKYKINILDMEQLMHYQA
jgi:CRP-like cAMP-binding protein